TLLSQGPINLILHCQFRRLDSPVAVVDDFFKEPAARVELLALGIERIVPMLRDEQDAIDGQFVAEGQRFRRTLGQRNAPLPDERSRNSIACGRRSLSAPNSFDPVAHFFQHGDQSYPLVALNLDPSILDGA